MEFRKWLTKNALSDQGIWLIFSKQKPSNTIKASEALEEALCFGWIDGQIKSIDENSYVKYFKQRNKNSNWSEKNKRIVKELEQKNLMTSFGKAKIEDAKQNGHWESSKHRLLTQEQWQQFENMVKPYEKAYTNFTKMSQSVSKAYVASYFFGVKSEKGKQKKLKNIIECLRLNLNPMESIKKKF